MEQMVVVKHCLQVFWNGMIALFNIIETLANW